MNPSFFYDLVLCSRLFIVVYCDTLVERGDGSVDKELAPLGFKIRPVKSSFNGKSVTWYDYKMASVGTLMDYGMYLRTQVGSMVVVYREGNHKVVVYQEGRLAGWKKFYEVELPKILEKEKGQIT